MRVSKEGVPELRLTETQVDTMEQLCLKRGDVQGYLLVGLMGRRSWRISSIVGYERDSKYSRRQLVRQPNGSLKEEIEVVTKHYSLPGIRRDDVGDDQVAIHMKGKKNEPIRVTWQVVPEPYMSRLKELARKTHFGERLIPWSEQQANRFLQELAREAGVPRAERIHNHRLRHFFGTHASRELEGDVPKIQSLMGHSDSRSTMIYIAELTPEEERATLAKLQKKRETEELVA